MFQTKKVNNILYFPLLCSIIIYGQRCDNKFMYKTRLGTLCTLDLSWLPLPTSCESVTDHHRWSGLIQRVQDTLYMYQVWTDGPGQSLRCTRTDSGSPGSTNLIAMWPLSLGKKGGDFGTYRRWTKMDNTGITRCTLLKRFQIWWSQIDTFPN